MRIVLTAPTVFELAQIIEYLDYNAEKLSFSKYNYLGHSIEILVTGVGIFNTGFAMARVDTSTHIDLAIQMGLAGSFKKEIAVGTIVLVEKDQYADLGVEESNGGFTSVIDLGLVDRDIFPFKQGSINAKYKFNDTTLTHCTGITVNTVSGCTSTIAQRKEQFNADIETMEGAAFYQACRMLDIDCVQIRGISNMVEPRNRENWNIELALLNLKQEFLSIFPTLVS